MKMATRLESVSGRHLFITFSLLIISQIVWFSIGSVAPSPTRTNWSSYNENKIVCLSSEVNDTWISTGSCEYSDRHDPYRSRYYDETNRQSNGLNWKNATSIDVGFKFQYIHATQEKLTVILKDISAWESDNDCNMTMDFTIQAKLGHQSRYEYETDYGADWQLLASSTTNQSMNCYTTFSRETKKCSYWCKDLPMFELQSLNYHMYFLNLRISTSNEGSLNVFKNVGFSAISTDDGFSILWWSMKTVFTVVIFVAILWYCKQMRKVSRKASLMERMIVTLAIALQLYNIPLEWFTLLFDFPFFQLLNGIRKDILYGTLMIFWLIFIKEHMQDSGKTTNILRSYRISIFVISLCSVASFTPDLVDTALHSVNPFYTLWSTYMGKTLCLVHIIIVSILAFVYLFYLMWTIRKLYKNPSYKSLTTVQRSEPPTKSPQPSESPERYQCCSMFNGLIEITLSSNPNIPYPKLSMSVGFRHTIIVILTGLCATLTVIDFVVRKVTTDQWKWNGYTNGYMHVSEFYTGVYGLWNVYAVALMYLYSPVPQMPSYETDNGRQDPEKNKFCSDDDDAPLY